MRSSLLLNKFDNPLTGVRFDGGPIGVLINGGNQQSAGSFWSAETCNGPATTTTRSRPRPRAARRSRGLLVALGVTGRHDPHLSAGAALQHARSDGARAHVVRADDAEAHDRQPRPHEPGGVDDTLSPARGAPLLRRDLAARLDGPRQLAAAVEARRHGVPGPQRGGRATSRTGTSTGRRSTPYKFGWGYGADLGGLSQQPDAPDAGIELPVQVTTTGGSPSTRQRTGDRTFDYNKDGVAHYGLYADWFEDLRQLGGQRLSKDMWNGAEAYLEMWERATGMPHARLPRDPQDDHGPRPRTDPPPARLGEAAAPPGSRSSAGAPGAGACAAGATGTAADVAELSQRRARRARGQHGARGRRPAGIAVGAKTRRVRRAASRSGAAVRAPREPPRRPSSTLVRDGRVRRRAVATRASLAVTAGSARRCAGCSGPRPRSSGRTSCPTPRRVPRG